MSLMSRLGRIAMAPVLAGLLCVASATPSLARQSWDDDDDSWDDVEVTFCNKTSGTIYLALMYLEENRLDDWIVEGWKNIAGNSCGTWNFAREQKFFYYAEDVGPTGNWGGGFELCVEYPGPFRRVNSGSYSCGGDRLKGFKEVNPGDNDTYTITLSP